MSYILFLDDMRRPNLQLIDYAAERGMEIHVVKDCAEASKKVFEMDCPAVLSLDHDLGEFELGGVKPNACAFLRILLEDIMDGLFADKVERVIIHSNNPAGQKNLQSIWDSYARVHDNPTRAEIIPRETLTE